MERDKDRNSAENNYFQFGGAKERERNWYKTPAIRMGIELAVAF